MMSTHFFQMDPSAVSLEMGATTEPHAIITTDMVLVPETPAISDMYVTNVAGPTQGMTALPHNSPSSGNGQGLAIGSPAPVTESKDTFSPLPIPINVQRLKDALTNHPDQDFVSRLRNNFRYGVDVGFTGRRVSRFSRNLPSAVSQPSIVTENLSREVALR